MTQLALLQLLLSLLQKVQVLESELAALNVPAVVATTTPMVFPTSTWTPPTYVPVASSSPALGASMEQPTSTDSIASTTATTTGSLATSTVVGNCTITITQKSDGVYGTWGYSNPVSVLNNQYLSTPGWQGNMYFENTSGTWVFFNGVDTQGTSQLTKLYDNTITGTGVDTPSLDAATQFELTYSDGTVCTTTAE